MQALEAGAEPLQENGEKALRCITLKRFEKPRGKTFGRDLRKRNSDLWRCLWRYCLRSEELGIRFKLRYPRDFGGKLLS